MQIQIRYKALKEIVAALGDDGHLLGQPAYATARGNPLMDISLHDVDLEHLRKMLPIMKAHEEDITPKVAKLIKSLENVDNRRVTSLEQFPAMFKEYLKANGNPLLHSLRGELRGVAYLPVDCEYHSARRNSYREDPQVVIRLAYNTKFEYREYSIVLNPRDTRGSSVPEILRHQNLMVPDETMSADYTKVLERFRRFCGMQGEQFWCKGEASAIGDREEYWWRSRTLNMTVANKLSKAVLDMELMAGRADRSRARVASNLYGDDLYDVPTHPVLPMFSLVYHKYAWVNVVSMKPYVYEEGLAERLVLPASHTRLVGALVSNLDALRIENDAEDKSRLIKSKSSSSVILAKGPAGTGKTLTAEVYAEEIQRPLYEIQSGQLGTDAETIEGNLKEILERSVKLRMPLLINEADVFLQKRRDGSMEQNAVVAVFLRLLEYHTGLVFLTTNRPEDIDEAFASRCIAEIEYGIPGASERKRLWELKLGEFGVELTDAEIKRAVKLFPNVVGRDIQNFIRLTSRVCIALKEEFSLEALIQNAVFRNIKVEDV